MMRSKMKNSTDRILTMEGLIAKVYMSDGMVPSGVSFRGYKVESNHNIFRAFKSSLRQSYGPVLPRNERGRQLINTGGMV